jgi:hypothetical protein
MAGRKPTKRLSIEEVEDLELRFYDLVGAEDDAAIQERREIFQLLRGAGAHLHCPPDEALQWIDIPEDHEGKPFRIGRRTYKGRMQLPLCEVRQLMSLIDGNRRYAAGLHRNNGTVQELRRVTKADMEGLVTPTVPLQGGRFDQIIDRTGRGAPGVGGEVPK